MRKLKIFSIVVTIFLFACDVNFSDLGVPNNTASYTLKIVDEQYDIATEMLKYANGISKNDSGALCIDTTIVYSKTSGIAFNKTSFGSVTLWRKPPYYLTGIAAKSFSFSPNELSGNFSTLPTTGSGTFSFGAFTFSQSKNNNTNSWNPYTEFKYAIVTDAKLTVTATNNLGFKVTGLKVTVSDSSGTALKTFSLDSVSNGSSASASETISSLTYTQFINVKVEGSVGEYNKLLVTTSNKLTVDISFATLTDATTGKAYQIKSSDYYGPPQADTVIANWKQVLTIDKDKDGSSDFDIYNFNSTPSIINNLKIGFVTYCSDNVYSSFAFPEIHTSSTRNDTLTSSYQISKITGSSSSATYSNSLPLAGRYFGDTYSANANLFDTVNVNATFIFPQSSEFVRVLDQKIVVSLTLDSLAAEQMICKVKEDVVYGGISGTIPVSLSRFYVTDRNGNEVSEINLLDSSTISYSMNRIIKTQNSNTVNNFIRLKTTMSSSRNSNSRTYNDSASFGITPSLLINYAGSLPNDNLFLNLLKILPENFSYSVSPTLKASDTVIVINASTNLAVNLAIKAPIRFTTSGDTLIFVLRNDYGNGFRGMYKQFTSAQLNNSVYKNYISGNLVLNYKNTSNMTLGAKIIISTDSSVLYNNNILTTANTTTVGNSGYPSYIARVISLGNLSPNTPSGTVSASLSKNDLVPFLKDTCYVGVKIPINSSSASFSGELDLVGKIEFDYNNFGDL